jgi:hydroxypyruvate isomerase
MQIMDGNVLDNIRDHIDILGHVHIAAVPGRGEPDRGELDYPYIVRELVKMGYDGMFGLEYFPTESSEASLARQRSLENAIAG